MKIIGFITANGYLKKKMEKLNIQRNFSNLEREAWQVILLTSQKYLPFKELEKYDMVEIKGIECKKITNEPLAIPFLGTDTTPILSHQDSISKLLLTKAHLRNTRSSLHPIHATASTTLSRMMTGKFGILLKNGEEMIQNHTINCVTCKKRRLLYYVSPIGMTDMRMPPVSGSIHWQNGQWELPVKTVNPKNYETRRNTETKNYSARPRNQHELRYTHDCWRCNEWDYVDGDPYMLTTVQKED